MRPKLEQGLPIFGRITGTTDGLQQVERERLLDLFLHELRIVIDQFGGRILIRVGDYSEGV